MKMELVYTPKAREDLQNIKLDILSRFYSEQTAEKVLSKLTETARNLTVFPYMGKELAKITGVLTDYRCLFCMHNYIFYRVERNRVCVIRILNERQDYMRILFGKPEIEE